MAELTQERYSVRQAALEDMGKLLEVSWDRFVENEEGLNVFGWIYRADGMRDFMVLIYVRQPARDTDEAYGLDRSWITSSARFSLRFTEILAPDRVGDHRDCRRVNEMGWP